MLNFLHRLLLFWMLFVFGRENPERGRPGNNSRSAGFLSKRSFGVHFEWNCFHCFQTCIHASQPLHVFPSLEVWGLSMASWDKGYYKLLLDCQPWSSPFETGDFDRRADLVKRKDKLFKTGVITTQNNFCGTIKDQQDTRFSGKKQIVRQGKLFCFAFFYPMNASWTTSLCWVHVLNNWHVHVYFSGQLNRCWSLKE